MENEDTKVTGMPDVAFDHDDTRNDPFLRAILEHEKATDSLGTAIRDRDAKHAAAAAEAAFAFLLTALALFHRLENRESYREPRSRVGTAWYVVRTHHRAFADLLSRAQSELASPELHQLLEQHRISLELAMGGLGPTPDNATSEQADRRTSGQATSGQGS